MRSHDRAWWDLRDLPAGNASLHRVRPTWSADRQRATFRSARDPLMPMKRFLLILVALLFAFGPFVLLALCQTPPKPLGDEWWPVEQWTSHDLDTWSDALVRHGRSNSYTRVSLRLSGCDALEVTRTRDTVLKRKGDEITDDEIRRGKEGLAKFEALAKGAKRYCRIVDANAAYGRWECELRIVTVSGETIDVAAWIRANKYERRVAK